MPYDGSGWTLPAAEGNFIIFIKVSQRVPIDHYFKVCMTPHWRRMPAGSGSLSTLTERRLTMCWSAPRSSAGGGSLSLWESSLDVYIWNNASGWHTEEPAPPTMILETGQELSSESLTPSMRTSWSMNQINEDATITFVINSVSGRRIR